MDQTSKPNVLITEDDYLVNRMIRGVLEEAGYRVIGEATNGEEAVKMVHTLHPDVVLMDIDMPDMNGINASRKIQEVAPTPVVILTAYDMPELVQQASRAGVGAYLLKPPRASELDRAITIAIARFADLMQLRQLNQSLQEKNRALEQALAQIKTLEGLLPICARCKKIRDDKGYWHEVEIYIHEHTDAQFTHGICNTCAEDLYADYLDS